MSFIHLITWFSLLLAVSAQTATATTNSKATSTTSTGIATWTIKVGHRSDPHQYVPHSLKASVGDIVVFEFYPRNHSVVEADYDVPCQPAHKPSIFTSGHFNSFNEQNGQLIGPPPTWSLVVNDTKPTFFYCTAIDSCNVNGMVGVINPNATHTWESQYKKAKEQTFQLEPGQSIPAEGGGGSGTSTGSSSSSTSSSSADSSSGSHLSGGAIAGIVVGGVAFVAILVALFFVIGRNQVYKKWMTSEDGRTERTARWALFNGHHGEHKSDWGSTQPPGEQVASMPSPDPTQRTFSGQYGPSSGQPGWDPSMFQPMPQSPPATNVAPTELEAPDSAIPPYRDDRR
ncbi:hypothetical protein BDV29DRAFT_161359 [Aspergillus leporis]|uniref:Cupredoxin n=1 Tax=Aspergillus leporis TaxID=41062 RepID=A0A5N5WMM7_9EURO|nr:hypothetical protein BDV29DRAFT_161359 [Aspergillus leporis]